MQPLSLLVAVLMGVLALAFVLYPLLRRAPGIGHADAVSHSAPVSSETEREQIARNALQEIELDFQLGNLAEPDYRSLRERYVRRAFVAMKFRREREEELDELIEERLRRMRGEEDGNERE